MSSKSEKIGEIIAHHHHREGPMLPILHDIPAEFGCVDEESEVRLRHRRSEAESSRKLRAES